MRAVIVSSEHRLGFQGAVRTAQNGRTNDGALAVFAVPFERGPTLNGDYEYYGVSDRILAATKEAGIPYKLA
jgi:hypothetical protein